MLTVEHEERVAIIDTGFNGDLELPSSLRERLSARHVGRITSALAGGRKIEEDAYLVAFPFDGRILLAEATFVQGTEILVGTRLMREHRLEVDFAVSSVRLKRAS